MIALVRAFEGISLDLVDEVRAWNLAEVLPRIRTMDGYRAGISLLNRDQRRVLSITLYDSEEQARAAVAAMADVRDRMPADLRERIEASGRSGPTDEYCEVLLSDGL